MFHRDPSIRTINDAIVSLYSQPLPMLEYHQEINVRNLYSNMGAYSSYIHFIPGHKTITISFPHECQKITRVKNNKGCKMVVYEIIDSVIKERAITSKSIIHYRPDTKIVIYTRGYLDLNISYDVTMIKQSQRSKL
jgi:hypothetical protein